MKHNYVQIAGPLKLFLDALLCVRVMMIQSVNAWPGQIAYPAGKPVSQNGGYMCVCVWLSDT